MDDPAHLTQSTYPTAVLPQRSSSPTTSICNINNKVYPIGSNSVGIGGDQDRNVNNDGGDAIQATAKFSSAGLESILKSVDSRLSLSASTKDMNLTATTPGSTVVTGRETKGEDDQIMRSIRSLNPQLSVLCSPIPTSSRAFTPIPSTASTADGLSPASAPVTPGIEKSSGESGSSDTSTFDSFASLSSTTSPVPSMTSASPSSVTELSHPRLSQQKKVLTLESELGGIDNNRQHKGVSKQVTLERQIVTGPLISAHDYESHNASENVGILQQLPPQFKQYLAHRQQDQVVQDFLNNYRHPLELYYQVLPPVSADLHSYQPQVPQNELFMRPRVCKLITKHPSVKLNWKVPEPIKAGGEVLRGVLIITAKELLETEVKAAVKSKSKKVGANEKRKKWKHDRYVWIEHIEIDLTGLEEVTTGAGLLSRTRTDRHCFLHKTQILPVEELKIIMDTPSSSSSSTTSSSSSSSSPSSSSFSSSSPTSSVITPIHSSISTQSRNVNENFGPISSRSSSLSHSSSSPDETDAIMPGKLAPGTQQGISFQMRIPERVGSTFRNAHASISYQLIANVHIRRGKEMFVLQHPLALSLFELVQVCAATKVTSPHDTNPNSSPGFSRTMTASSTTSSPASISTSPTSISRRQAGVRFVIPKANSVLGTAAVRPYSLWGLGPATSSSHHSHHGYGHNNHGYWRHSHQRRRSLGSPNAPLLNKDIGMLWSHSDIGTISSQLHSKEDSSVSGSSATVSSLKKTRFDAGEMLSAEDQYRTRKQFLKQQELELQKNISASSRQRVGACRDNDDELDEVGFGAHIDKSVVAAGENVTMDMFVVKSNMMKVVDIKVSLVETIQIFSLLENDNSSNVVSPLAGRAHGFETHLSQQQQQPVAMTNGSKRKLVETHMVKIAKAYVPAQSEENHANDNHLKGYYEDYEDARTTKSLSIYKLSMRIPETALTIQERDLFKVDYMFVIKFFFKGRVGAFLELPIEIVSQYNHNRISTISGAISCVTNSVQIALPPVPILIRRNDGPRILSDSSSVASTQDAAEETVKASASHNLEEEEEERESDKQKGNSIESKNAVKEIQSSSIDSQRPQDINTSDADSSRRIIVDQTTVFKSKDLVDISSLSEEKPAPLGEVRAKKPTSHQGTSKQDSATATSIIIDTPKTNTQMPSGESTRASFRLSKAEFKACASRHVGLTVAHFNKMSSASPASAPVKDSQKIKSTETKFNDHEGVPKIVIESIKPKEQASHNPTNVETTTTVVTPALPILFDLTSAALPTPVPSTVSPPLPSPLTISRAMTSPISSSMTQSSHSNSMSRTANSAPIMDTISHSNSFPKSAKNIDTRTPKLQPLRQGASSSSHSSSSSSNEDSYNSQDQDTSNGKAGGGIVAKIAKSLSSPLLRSRTGAISPSGSQSNLASISPQQPSSAFTLAASTLSALTLFSSVNQATVNSDNKKAPHLPLAPTLQTGPLKSCIKKRPTTRPPGLNTENLGTTATQYRGSLSAAPSQGHHSYNVGNMNRKRVTFAKGLTPVPSPAGSQILVPEQVVLDPFKSKNNVQFSAGPCSTSSSSISTIGGMCAAGGPHSAPVNSTSGQTSLGIMGSMDNQFMSTRPMTPSFPQHQYYPQHQHGSVGSAATAISSPRSPSMTKSSNGTTNPRPKIHDPFDAHPSRLSPLEKRHLGFQIHEGHSSSRYTGMRDLSSGLDDDNEDSDEGDHDEEGQEEDEDSEDDEDEDDDQETEEERIERRRQARIAWLAKYGDAFKQVYGAVPELPPL
ncbi:hypothetical protein FBU30_004597 [Linnemannia zychae]|nr:hypothetical protein FBU30_004597 [Linnemannia zychae]